jgi:hypothetical protein
MGTPGATYRGHCARSGIDAATTIAIELAAITNDFMI